MPSSTVENYLKQAYLLQQKAPGSLVPMGQLAERMDVAPGTTTAMVKALADSGLLDYEPREGVRLTHRGERLALHVLRRHRLVEQFLVQVLDLDWAEVHAEAEELEHTISDKLLERIDEFLGHPATDPHGDPIPTAAGTLAQKSVASLADCDTGKPLRITRVLDQRRDFLQFVDRHGLTPGVDLVVQHRDAAADSVTVEPEDGQTVTVGTTAAGKILVEVL